ncbi:hypothetical protein ABIE56_001971 [Luteibacter sp. 621]|uniref:hypothetical protein n=1 Tax=Luteibacter sp. 621 TaxID=3373916 RepID=UPI003D260BE3
MTPFRVVLTTALACLAFAAHAGIETGPGSGYHAAVLEEDIKQFTNAIVNYAVEYRGTPLTTTQVNRLRRTASSATVARMEYTWNASDTRDAGRLTIHSRSGKPLETLVATVPSGTSGSDSDGSFQWNSDQIDREAGEARFYPHMEGHIRATAHLDNNSVLRETDPKNAGDAELKALQTLEANIKAGTVPRGGTLKGTVSKAICRSCEANLALFSKEYDVHGKVFYLANENEAVAAREAATTAEEKQLIEDSVRSNREVFTRRNRYLDQVMPKQLGEWRRIGDASWIDRRSLAALAEAEAGSLTARECP